MSIENALAVSAAVANLDAGTVEPTPAIGPCHPLPGSLASPLIRGRSQKCNATLHTPEWSRDMHHSCDPRVVKEIPASQKNGFRANDSLMNSSRKAQIDQIAKFVSYVV